MCQPLAAAAAEFHTLVYDPWDDSIRYKHLPQDYLSVYLDMSEQPTMSSVV